VVAVMVVVLMIGVVVVVVAVDGRFGDFGGDGRGNGCRGF